MPNRPLQLKIIPKKSPLHASKKQKLLCTPESQYMAQISLARNSGVMIRNLPLTAHIEPISKYIPQMIIFTVPTVTTAEQATSASCFLGLPTVYSLQ